MYELVFLLDQLDLNKIKFLWVAIFNKLSKDIRCPLVKYVSYIAWHLAANHIWSQILNRNYFHWTNQFLVIYGLFPLIQSHFYLKRYDNIYYTNKTPQRIPLIWPWTHEIRFCKTRRSTYETIHNRRLKLLLNGQPRRLQRINASSGLIQFFGDIVAVFMARMG